MVEISQGVSAALRAYAEAQRTKQAGGGGGEVNPGGFAALVKDALGQAVETGQAGEVRSLSAIADKADLNQVVSAVAEAELTLETVVAVRDRVLDAYREIIRMPI